MIVKGEERERKRKRERERERSIPLKDDFEASKRRKTKRDQRVSHLQSQGNTLQCHISHLYQWVWDRHRTKAESERALVV
ncbi:hypothetical protein IGI04_036861 [Brassica rapa subsp. trilocularis]|uniref:Uncharacterized protein n=1 Tax=Brassica rapa subsp. trilocularis TaxID=1813537 RepID=A0ABQ7LHW7_BRACM|nr:hypothetical protein IGI04_036861 [Brassica rapa subsp. trilocularis]